jgi:LPXTG-motif cell wall-anchored protein
VPTPTPNTPGGTLVPNEDGGLVELGEDGTPQGEWRYDEESGEWIFEPIVPLVPLPQTGMLNWPVPVMSGLGVVCFSAGFVLLKGNRKRDEEA